MNHVTITPDPAANERIAQTVLYTITVKGTQVPVYALRPTSIVDAMRDSQQLISFSK